MKVSSDNVVVPQTSSVENQTESKKVREKNGKLKAVKAKKLPMIRD